MQRGKIIFYNESDGKGLIAAADGQQYLFDISEWRSGFAPRLNQAVDLEPQGNRACAVVLVTAMTLLRESVLRTCRRLGSGFGFGRGPPREVPDIKPEPADKPEE